jgi:hypothetical protein
MEFSDVPMALADLPAAKRTHFPEQFDEFAVGFGVFAVGFCLVPA